MCTCKNLIIKNGGQSATCKIMDNVNMDAFIKIKNRFEEMHPGHHAVANQECPFYRTRGEKACPYFE